MIQIKLPNSPRLRPDIQLPLGHEDLLEIRNLRAVSDFWRWIGLANDKVIWSTACQSYKIGWIGQTMVYFWPNYD